MLGFGGCVCVLGEGANFMLTLNDDHILAPSVSFFEGAAFTTPLSPSPGSYAAVV